MGNAEISILSEKYPVVACRYLFEKTKGRPRQYVSAWHIQFFDPLTDRQTANAVSSSIPVKVSCERRETAKGNRDGVELDLLDLGFREILAWVQVNDIIRSMHSQ